MPRTDASVTSARLGTASADHVFVERVTESTPPKACYEYVPVLVVVEPAVTTAVWQAGVFA